MLQCYICQDEVFRDNASQKKKKWGSPMIKKFENFEVKLKDTRFLIADLLRDSNIARAL